MSSTSRQFFTPDDLAMLDRVLAHANFLQSNEYVKREARLEATRFLITVFLAGETSELGLRNKLADRGIIEAPKIKEVGAELAVKVSLGSFRSVTPAAYPGGGYQFCKRADFNGSWTVYHVFSAVPAQFGSWSLVELKAKTAKRALKILNSPERVG